MGVETIKRQTRAAYGCLIADQSLWAQSASEMTYIVSSGALNSTHSLTHCGRRLSLRPIVCTPALCDTKTPLAAVCGLWRFISVICLCFCL